MRLGTYYRAALLRSLGLAEVEGKVLDVGGYDGFWLSALSSERRVSVDIEAVPAFSGVGYVRGDGLRLPIRDGAFDVVFALDVIEHVDREEPFVAELMRVVKPGGRLIVTTPHERVRIFPALLQPWANRRWQHHRTPGYSPEAVRELFGPWQPQRVHVRELKTWGFRNLYLPLSAGWRIWRRPVEALLRRLAALDAGQAEAGGGYLLAEIVK